MTASDPLFNLDTSAQAHSDALLAIIQQRIAEAGGRLTFADYMQLCLYQPGLGYYSAGSEKLGELGDFTTAPEISPLFAQSLARHIEDVRHQLDKFELLEFGAGSGKMASDLLLALSQSNALPDHYYIIEASPHLRYRQQESIRNLAPEHIDRVTWLDRLPEQFSGVMVANEVCDAMPAHRLYFDETGCSESYVAMAQDQLIWQQGPLSHPLLEERAETIRRHQQESDYYTEVNLAAEGWVNSLADCLVQGAIFIIDYGHTQPHFYHPQRNRGTLMCYYQHRGHDNPLILPGLQDITSHVDFTALAESAHTAGLDVDGFQTQADFLLSGDITSLLAQVEHQTDTFEYLQQTTAMKRLILPSEMGESFKTLTLTKGLATPLARLQRGDLRYLL